MNQGVKAENYKTAYGLLRIIACLSVIYHHFIRGFYGNLSEPFWITTLAVVDNLLMCNNGLFFMLSGKFTLENYDSNIKKYYKHKLKRIGVPLLCVSLFYFIREHGLQFSFYMIGEFYQEFIGNEFEGYLWFVYALTGFYLVAPFLHYMLKALNEAEKTALTILLFGYIFVYNLCEIFHLAFAINGFPFYGYIAFCLLGYLVDNSQLFHKNNKICNAFFVISLVVSSWEVIYNENMNPSIYDFCITRLFLCIGLFLLITRKTERVVQKGGRLITFLGKYTYYIYLLHGIVQEAVMRYLKIPSKGVGLACAIVSGGGLIFIVTLLAAIIFEKVIGVIQNKAMK